MENSFAQDQPSLVQELIAKEAVQQERLRGRDSSAEMVFRVPKAGLSQ